MSVMGEQLSSSDLANRDVNPRFFPTYGPMKHTADVDKGGNSYACGTVASDDSRSWSSASGVTEGNGVVVVGGVCPMSMMQKLLSSGVAPTTACEMVTSYLQFRTAHVTGVDSASVPTSGIGSTRSSRRRARKASLRCEGDALVLDDGKCYLRLVKWDRRARLSAELGARPQISTLMAALRQADLDVTAAKACSVVCVKAVMGGGLYHVTPVPGPADVVLGTAYDMIARISEVFPRSTSLRFDCGPLGGVPILPLVALMGSRDAVAPGAFSLTNTYAYPVGDDSGRCEQRREAVAQALAGQLHVRDEVLALCREQAGSVIGEHGDVYHGNALATCVVEGLDVDVWYVDQDKLHPCSVRGQRYVDFTCVYVPLGSGKLCPIVRNEAGIRVHDTGQTYSGYVMVMGCLHGFDALRLSSVLASVVRLPLSSLEFVVVSHPYVPGSGVVSHLVSGVCVETDLVVTDNRVDCDVVGNFMQQVHPGGFPSEGVGTVVKLLSKALLAMRNVRRRRYGTVWAYEGRGTHSGDWYALAALCGAHTLRVFSDPGMGRYQYHGTQWQHYDLVPDTIEPTYGEHLLSE